MMWNLFLVDTIMTVGAVYLLVTHLLFTIYFAYFLFSEDSVPFKKRTYCHPAFWVVGVGLLVPIINVFVWYFLYRQIMDKREHK